MVKLNAMTRLDYIAVSADEREVSVSTLAKHDFVC